VSLRSGRTVTSITNVPISERLSGQRRGAPSPFTTRLRSATGCSTPTSSSTPVGAPGGEGVGLRPKRVPGRLVFMRGHGSSLCAVTEEMGRDSSNDMEANRAQTE
jgi:hypothetical protein